MKKFLILFCLPILILSCEKSENDPKTFDTDFSTHLLDGYFIYSIAFDMLGNAWIGTFKQGLIKYNKNEIIVFNSSNSIIQDTSVIHDIAVDSENNVWIGCEGIIKYDGTNFTLYNTSNTPIPEDYVKSIAIDSKDNIWFTSSRFRQGGVVMYDGSDWNVYTSENSDLPVNSIRSVTVDKNDNVWVALSEYVNDSYLVKISQNNWSIYTGNDLGFSPYYLANILTNSKNELCGAIDYSLSSTLYNQGPQIFIFDGDSSTQLKCDDEFELKSISIDNEDNIWCAGYSAYAVFNGKDWFVDAVTFKEESVFAIEQSPDRNIWIGTGDGIYIND